MTTLDGAGLLDGQVEALAPSGEPASSGRYLEPTTVVWQPMSREQREAYEKEFGMQPPGYRGTGAVDWFSRHHPDTAPCVTCGVTTDRFETRNNFLGGPPGYWGQACLCGVHVPVCVDCTRRQSITTLEQRQGNLEIEASVRAGEAVYLAQLKSELNKVAA